MDSSESCSEMDVYDEDMGDTDERPPPRGKGKSKKAKAAQPLQRKLTGMSSKARKANASLNNSIVRQTLKSNNRSLARALELARQEFSILQQQYVELQSEKIDFDRRIKKRLLSISDVISNASKKLVDSVSLLDEARALCSLDQGLEVTTINTPLATESVDEPDNAAVEAESRDAPTKTFEEPILTRETLGCGGERALEESCSVSTEDIKESFPGSSPDEPMPEVDKLINNMSTEISHVVSSLQSTQAAPVSMPPNDLSVVMEQTFFVSEVPILFSDDETDTRRNSGRPKSAGNLRTRKHSRSKSGRRSALIYHSSTAGDDATPDQEETKNQVEATESKGPRRSLRSRSQSLHRSKSLCQEQELQLPEVPVENEQPSVTAICNTDPLLGQSLEGKTSEECEEVAPVVIPQVESESSQPEGVTSSTEEPPNVGTPHILPRLSLRRSRNRLAAVEKQSLPSQLPNASSSSDIAGPTSQITTAPIEGTTAEVCPTRSSRRGTYCMNHTPSKTAAEESCEKSNAKHPTDHPKSRRGTYCMQKEQVQEHSGDLPTDESTEVSRRQRTRRNSKSQRGTYFVAAEARAGHASPESENHISDDITANKPPTDASKTQDLNSEDQVINTDKKKTNSESRRGTYFVPGEQVKDQIPVSGGKSVQEDGAASEESKASDSKEVSPYDGETEIIPICQIQAAQHVIPKPLKQDEESLSGSTAKCPDKAEPPRESAPSRRGTYLVPKEEEQIPQEKGDVGKELEEGLTDVQDLTLVDDDDAASSPGDVCQDDGSPQQEVNPAVKTVDQTICQVEDMDFTEVLHIPVLCDKITPPSFIQKNAHEPSFMQHSSAKQVSPNHSKVAKGKRMKLVPKLKPKPKGKESGGVQAPLVVNPKEKPEAVSKHQTVKSAKHLDASGHTSEPAASDFKMPANNALYKSVKAAAKKQKATSSESDSSDSDKEKIKFKAMLERPGKIVFKAGRKDLEDIKKDVSKVQSGKQHSKAKSMLPKSERPRSKSTKSKSRLLSLESTLKVGDAKSAAAGDKKDQPILKSVFDMSLNESITILPQMSYGDFREQNPAMDAMRAALKAKEDKSGGDNANGASPHGIMLVMGNGRRTKPRVRSKSVTYATQLAEVHLRTPSNGKGDGDSVSSPSAVNNITTKAFAGNTPPQPKKSKQEESENLTIPDTPNIEVVKKPREITKEDKEGKGRGRCNKGDVVENVPKSGGLAINATEEVQGDKKDIEVKLFKSPELLPKKDKDTPKKKVKKQSSSTRSARDSSLEPAQSNKLAGAEKKPDSGDAEAMQRLSTGVKRSLDCPEYVMEDEIKRPRRGAAQVSYKEPSLNSKLRRGDPISKTIYKDDDVLVSSSDRRSSKASLDKRKSTKRSRTVLSTITNADPV